MYKIKVRFVRKNIASVIHFTYFHLEDYLTHTPTPSNTNPNTHTNFLYNYPTHHTHTKTVGQHSSGPNKAPDRARWLFVRLGQFGFYVQLFTVRFVSLKRYIIKLCFVGLKMYKMYKNIASVIHFTYFHLEDYLKHTPTPSHTNPNTHTHFLYNYPTHHTHTKTDQPIISQHMTGYHPLINRKLALGFSHDWTIVLRTQNCLKTNPEENNSTYTRQIIVYYT